MGAYTRCPGRGHPIAWPANTGYAGIPFCFLLMWVFPLPATPPYSVEPLHMHGATGYGRYELGSLIVLVVGSSELLDALRGDLGDVIPGGAVVSRKLRPVMAA